jgi:flagellar biosynthesis/type III secretory pathway chaperone
MTTVWERDLADFLSELTAVQSELLEVLLAKRQCLVRSDAAAMTALQPREESIIARLEACQSRRQELLEQASVEGAPHANLRSAAKSLAKADSTATRRSLEEAASRARILQHHSLTNWVVTQRTLLHLAQMLEIIATGGRTQPTYGNAASPAGGCLVDQAA